MTKHVLSGDMPKNSRYNIQHESNKEVSQAKRTTRKGLAGISACVGSDRGSSFQEVEYGRNNLES